MTVTRLDLRDAIIEIWLACKGIFRALFFPATEDLTMLRNLHCRDCPFFDATWRTCGTPGEMMGAPVGIRIKVGCWCYLPLANRDAKKDCYARANDLDIGWPDLLRPKNS